MIVNPESCYSYNPESCSITYLANSKLFLIVNLLVVKGSKIGTKCLDILSDGVLIGDKMGQKGDNCQSSSCEFYKDLYKVTKSFTKLLNKILDYSWPV